MASITDLFDRVSDSNTGRPIIAELASPGKAIGASSLNLAAATNWSTDSAIHFSIYETMTVGNVTVKDSSTQTDWKGTLSGTTIGNLTITGGTDRAYTAGAKVELTPTSRYSKDLYDGIAVGHNQNGTHKAFTESNIVPTAAIQDGAVTSAKLNITATSYTNPGTAGGTFYRATIGGVKFFWGQTSSLSVTGSGFASNAYTVTFPVGYFSTIQSCQISSGPLSATVYQGCAINTVTATELSLFVNQFSGTNGAQVVQVFTTGT